MISKFSAQSEAMLAAKSVAAGTLSADDTFVGPITVTNCNFAVSITGTFVGKVTIQAKPVWRDFSPDWDDIRSTTDKPYTGQSKPVVETWLVRVGFKAGDYTSGDAVVAINGGEPENQVGLVTRTLPR